MTHSTTPAPRVQHACPGRDCLVCAMAQRHGYVRTYIGLWRQPNGDGPLLTDDEARRLIQGTLFEEAI